jgi:hypothetical protein
MRSGSCSPRVMPPRPWRLKSIGRRMADPSVCPASPKGLGRNQRGSPLWSRFFPCMLPIIQFVTSYLRLPKIAALAAWMPPHPSGGEDCFAGCRVNSPASVWCTIRGLLGAISLNAVSWIYSRGPGTSCSAACRALAHVLARRQLKYQPTRSRSPALARRFWLLKGTRSREGAISMVIGGKYRAAFAGTACGGLSVWSALANIGGERMG